MYDMKAEAEWFRKTRSTTEREGLSKRKGRVREEQPQPTLHTYVTTPLHDTQLNIRCRHTSVSISLYDTRPNIQCIPAYTLKTTWDQIHNIYLC